MKQIKTLKEATDLLDEYSDAELLLLQMALTDITRQRNLCKREIDLGKFTNPYEPLPNPFKKHKYKDGDYRSDRVVTSVKRREIPPVDMDNMATITSI